MDDYNRGGGRLIDNDEQGIIQVGLNHHTLPIAFLQLPKKHPFPPSNRYLMGERGNCPFFGAVCSKNFMKRGA